MRTGAIEPFTFAISRWRVRFEGNSDAAAVLPATVQKAFLFSRLGSKVWGRSASLRLRCPAPNVFRENADQPGFFI